MPEGMEASFCSCDYETFDWYKSKMVKARKQHICCECDQSIEPGEIYERAKALFDERWWTYATCEICTRIRTDYCAPYEGLRETLWEHLGCDYVDGTSLLDDEDEEEEAS